MKVREMEAILATVKNKELEIRVSPCYTPVAQHSVGIVKVTTCSNPIVEVEEFPDQLCLWRET